MVDYRTPFVSDSELETRLKFSRSQKSTRLSAPPEASRNSCGWNSTSFTDAVCSRSSDNNRPARKSHIFYIEKTVSQGKHTFTWGLRKRKKKKTGNTAQDLLSRTFTAPSSPAEATHWPSGLNRRLFTVIP